MLQQTQVDRVIPKYTSFIKKFRSFKGLAKAQTRDVLREWQGLGYNRRALNLKRAAEIIVERYNGALPHSYEDLVALPGVGPYTAKALRTFIWNASEVFIETNIRSVFITHYADICGPGAEKRRKISDAELVPFIEKSLDIKNPREWYYALMDYGSYLKRTYPNPNRRSVHHTKQSKFKGSRRELRGTILRMLHKQKSLTIENVMQETEKKNSEIRNVLSDLAKEGFIKTSLGQYRIV